MSHSHVYHSDQSLPPFVITLTCLSLNWNSQMMFCCGYCALLANMDHQKTLLDAPCSLANLCHVNDALAFKFAWQFPHHSIIKIAIVQIIYYHHIFVYIYPQHTSFNNISLSYTQNTLTFNIFPLPYHTLMN